MARTHDLNAMSKQLRRLDKLMETQRRKFYEMRDQLGQMLANQKHYLRVRAPKVLARQKQLLAKSARLYAQLEKIGRMSIKLNTTDRHTGKTRVVFLCTGNEARKLRALLAIDFRQLNGLSRRTCGLKMGEKL